MGKVRKDKKRQGEENNLASALIKFYHKKSWDEVTKEVFEMA